jgi:hypothetical protein
VSPFSSVNEPTYSALIFQRFSVSRSIGFLDDGFTTKEIGKKERNDREG